MKIFGLENLMRILILSGSRLLENFYHLGVVK
nr:MAG TPA: hypothetical protein [Caudoviricetes sp.]